MPSPLLLVALALPAAQAEGFVSRVGEPQVWEQGGVWSRPMPTDDGWKLFLATQNDFWVADLVEGAAFGEWELDRESKINLTNRGTLQDNSLARCPDGSFLIASSASLVDPNDSSYWTWVSADFEVLGSGPVEESSNARPHNDLVSVCNPVATGVVHTEFGSADDFTSTLFHVDLVAGEVSGTSSLADVKAEGGAIAYDSRDGSLVATMADLFFNGAVVVFDDSLALLEKESVDLVDGDWKETWPQGLLRVGDYWLVATLARDEEEYGRGEFGDVFLVVLDDSFKVLQRERLTTYLDDGGENVNRPWLAREDERLMVGFDALNRHGVLEVELDLEAFGVEPGSDDGGGDDGWTGGGDDGTGDDGATGADGGEDDVDGASGCRGCAAKGTSGLGWAGLVGVLGLLGLRRRGHPGRVGMQ